MGKTCLITGGAGFIGCATSHLLVKLYDRVMAFDNLHPQIHATATRPADLDSRAELVVGDVRKSADWDALLQIVQPDVILHLAAETGTAQSLLEATRHSSTNVVGTTQMTDALARNKIIPEKIVLASSRAVYGEGRWIDEKGQTCYPGMRTHAMLEAGQWEFPGLKPTVQFSPEVAPDPANVYAATKLCQENLLSSWCGSMGVELVRFRLQNVYGAGQSLINPYTGIVSLFARLAKAGKPIPVYEDGKIIRDFVYIDDVSSALAAGVERGHTNRYPYDVGLGKATTIHELAVEIANYYQAPDPVITGQYREGDIRAGWADISQTSTALEWNPAVNIATGIERLCNWIDARNQEN